jgi:hypothetical protein
VYGWGNPLSLTHWMSSMCTDVGAVEMAVKLLVANKACTPCQRDSCPLKHAVALCKHRQCSPSGLQSLVFMMSSVVQTASALSLMRASTSVLVLVFNCCLGHECVNKRGLLDCLGRNLHF